MKTFAKSVVYTAEYILSPLHFKKNQLIDFSDFFCTVQPNNYDKLISTLYSTGQFKIRCKLESGSIYKRSKYKYKLSEVYL